MKRKLKRKVIRHKDAHDRAEEKMVLEKSNKAQLISIHNRFTFQIKWDADL